MSSSEVAALAARLQRLEDLQAIHQLFVDYGRHLDQGDWAAYAALFADDGEVLLGPMGRAQGPEHIRALMEGLLADKVGETIHIISSPAVVLDGDTATSEVMWTVLRRMEDGSPKLTACGRHQDLLVRQRGVWKIRQRRGFIDLPSVLAPT
ncbi:MAG: nuclear transport factor 2 family protein [Actinomycetota bacterium]|nr:nuclear transport factor 2 family protein [Actinomycetota bacterium]